MTQIWHGAVVITGRRRRGGMETIRQGAVAVDAQKITAVGPYRDLVRQFPDAWIIDRTRHAIIPGLVDGHHHQGVAPIRLGARAQSLEHVFMHRRSLRSPHLYEDTLYGGLMLLSAGITTVNHLHVGRRGPWQEWREDAETVLRAYADAGIRANFTFNFRDQNRLLYDGDDWFDDQLSGDDAAQMRSFLDGQKVPLDSYLDELFVGLWEDRGRNTNPDVRISLAPHNLHWCSDESIVRIMDTARRHGVHVNMHLLESPRQRLYAERRTGTTAIDHLGRLGALGNELTLLHGVWATQDDLALLADTGTRVCVSVGSNLLMGSGLPPVGAMLEQGVPVSLGLDEGGVDSRYDLFSDMRLVQGLNQQADRPGQSVACADTFAMATSGSAASTEFRSDVGTLDVGRFADFVVLDWERINEPVGPTGPTDTDDLVYKANTAHITDVVVGGDPVVQDGKHRSIDRRELLQEIGRQMAGPLTSEDRVRLELFDRVRPVVDQYWARYGSLSPADPYLRHNSRR